MSLLLLFSGSATGGTFTADAIIQKTQSASITADAVFKKTVAGSFTADAVVRFGFAGSFTADAIIFATRSGSFTADSVLRKTQSGSFTADAFISSSITATFTANAVLHRTQSASFTLDAVIAEVTDCLTDPFDRVVSPGTDWGTGVLGAWEGSSGPTFEVDGSVGIYTGDSTNEGWVDVPSQFDSVDTMSLSAKFRWPTDDFTTYAEFALSLTQADDHAVNYFGGAVVYDGDFYIYGFSNFFFDSFTLPDPPPDLGDEGNLKIDVDTTTGEGRVKFWVEGDPEPDWQLVGDLGAGDFDVAKTAHAFFTTDDEQTWNIDDVEVCGTSGGTPDFTVDAILRVGRSASFTINAVIVPRFTANAVIKRNQTGSFTANAVIERVPINRTVDAVIKRSQSASFAADAVIAARFFRANAVIKRAQSASFLAAAWIYSPRTTPSLPNQTPITQILVGDIDVTDDVVFNEAEFIMLVNGAVGQCRLKIRDRGQTWDFTSGAEITVDIDGKRRFGGYIMEVARTYAFPAVDTSTPSAVARFWTLTGVDFNILFQKRILYDPDDLANVNLREWPAGSDDDVVIRYVFDNYTDLAADGATTAGVTHIGSPNPDRKGVVGSAGLTFGDAMREINRLISGVFYFNPYKELVFVDVDTPNASRSLTDHPASAVNGGGSAPFADSKNLAGVITDPSQGTTTIECDPSAFTIDPTDPEIFEDWTGDGSRGAYSAWLKIILTESATMKFNTYGSDMVDTLLFLFEQPAAPGSTDLPDDLSDDNDEPGHNSGPDVSHSALPDGGGGYGADGSFGTYGPGTYWIAVMPYDGASWDTGEGSFLLNIIRSDGDDPDAPLELGFREFGHTENGSGLVNDAMVWGAGTGSTRMVFAREQDATSQSVHGLWQWGEFTSSLYKQASVDRRADSVVNGTPQSKRGGKDDQVSWNATTFDTSFGVGEKVQIESVVWGVSDVVPIRRLRLTFPTKKDPKFDLVLSHEIDQPWNLFEFYFPGFHFGGFGPFGIQPPVDGVCSPAICGPTDNFGRTESGEWGMALAGREWETTQVHAATTLSVAAGQARILMPAYSAFGSRNTRLTLDAGPVVGFTMDFTLEQWEEVTAQFEGLAFGVQISPNFVFSFTNVWPASGGQELTITSFGPFASTSMTYQLNPDVIYHLRFEIEEGVAARVKIWAGSEPGPWTLELSTTAPLSVASPGFQIQATQISASSSPSSPSALEVFVSNLRLYGPEGAITRCSFSQFDLFDRVVASGSWGTSTDGHDWSEVGDGDIYVNYGEGVLRAYVSGPSHTQPIVRAVDPGPWNLDTYTLVTAFTIEDAPTAGHDHLLDIGQVDIAMSTDPDDSYFAAAGGANVPIDPSFWVAGTRYSVDYVVVHNAATATITDGIDTYVATDLTGGGESSFFEIELHSFISSGDQKVTFHFIHFDYPGKPCYDDVLGDGIFGSGPSRVDLFGDGLSTLLLPSRYVPGSTRVFKNGAFQRPLGNEYDETDYVTGQIDLVTPADIMDEITVFYEADGPS